MIPAGPSLQVGRQKGGQGVPRWNRLPIIALRNGSVSSWFAPRQGHTMISPSSTTGTALDDPRQMNDERLVHYAAAWAPGTWHRLIAEEELKRRHGRRSARPMIAVALCVIAALFVVASL